MHPLMRVGKSEIIYSSVGQGSAARCCSRRVAVEAQAVVPTKRKGLGVRCTAKGGQATVLAGRLVEEVRSECSDERGHFETRGLHTFRHTYTSLLTQNNEDVRVVQELLRGKHEAQRKVVEMVLKRGGQWPKWTITDHDGNRHFSVSACERPLS
jgi:integrase